MKSYGVNSVATHYPYAYTVTKDLYLAKWDISNILAPKIVRYVKGNYRIPKDNEEYKGHREEILCVAVAPDGKHVVTGGRDKRIVVWTTESLSPVKVIHIKNGNKPAAVTAITFRRGSTDFYASCSDLVVRVFNVTHMAQTEVLYGHQDCVADISALAAERCLTVGSRDRSAMLWKITEESRLTFRGGDSEKVIKKIGHENTGAMLEGSIDVCTMIDDAHFVTGSDNGNISLWSTQRKRPLCVIREAHGRDAPLTKEQASADTSNNGDHVEIPPPMPRGITALYAIPYSDLIFSGSWDGQIKVWKLSADLRSFDLLGTVTIPGFNRSEKENADSEKPDLEVDGKQNGNLQNVTPVSNKDVKSRKKYKKNKHDGNAGLGVINRICVAESGTKGHETYAVVAAVSKEIKNGRWIKIKNGKNGLLTFRLDRVSLKKNNTNRKN